MTLRKIDDEEASEVMRLASFDNEDNDFFWQIKKYNIHYIKTWLTQEEAMFTYENIISSTNRMDAKGGQLWFVHSHLQTSNFWKNT